MDDSQSRSSWSITVLEEDSGDLAVSCSGKSCQSCSAGVIADCVAMCCCPCAVVNILMLSFVKLPWAVARRCLDGGRRRSRRRGLEQEKKCYDGGRDVICEDKMTSDVVLGGGVSGKGLNDNLSVEEMYDDVDDDDDDEVGHLGFGRVSFTEIPFHDRGN